jgi:hypothetical protein
MTYTTYYLKFSSEEEMKTVFESLNWIRTSPVFQEGQEPPTYYSMRPELNGDIDVVGVIYNNDAVYEMNEDGYPSVISEATAKDGWHVNIILEGSAPEELTEYILDPSPSTPNRVFA